MAIAREISEIQEYVSIPTIGQALFCLSKRQLLSLSLVRLEKMVRIPMYTFVQQPVWLFSSYSILCNTMSIIARVDSNQSTRGYSSLQFADSGRNIIVNAVPISFREPEYCEVNMATYLQKQDAASGTEPNTNVNAMNVHHLSKIERQRNWCIQHRRRQNGIIDKFYCHLQTNFVYRSLIEVYNFIEFGKLPSRYKKETDADPTKSDKGSLRRMRGSSLLTRKEVGYYEYPCGTICRTPIATSDLEKSQNPALSKSAKTQKRKREEGLSIDQDEQSFQDSTSTQEVQSSQNVELGVSIAHRSPLYDFEPRCSTQEK